MSFPPPGGYDDAHRPRRIGLSPRNPRQSWQCGSARGHMKKLSAGKFHRSRLLGSIRNLWNIAGDARLLRLDAGELDHLGPLFGFVGNELAEVRRRASEYHAADLCETRSHFG